MSHSTPNLVLPLIQPNQAQKHVTHNEALQVLDALVQPTVLDRTLSSPPLEPSDGDSYIVATAGTGDWVGQDGSLAVFANGGWLFFAPSVGWKTYVESESVEVVFDGAAWSGQVSTQADMLGLNASADSTNRLAISAPATLLTHEGAGHQLKLNKASLPDTNSLLFQTNWSGRAEMGCVGDDDFSIKVSGDGVSFQEGLVVEAGTGAVRFPNGIAGTGSAAGKMGGQIIALTCAFDGPLLIGSTLSFGGGTGATAGAVIPFDGAVLWATVSIAGGAAGNTTLQGALNQVVDSQYEISATYSGSGVATAIADFSAAPLAVSAGTGLGLICSNTTGAENVVATLYVLID